MEERSPGPSPVVNQSLDAAASRKGVTLGKVVHFKAVQGFRDRNSAESHLPATLPAAGGMSDSARWGDLGDTPQNGGEAAVSFTLLCYMSPCSLTK